MNPKYPVYIISKGRWKNRLTSKVLEKFNIPYKIIIDPSEYYEYASVIDVKKIIHIPSGKIGVGSVPARNIAWEHAIHIGAEKHWLLDDNISGFCRYNHNIRVPVESGIIFKCAEDFTDRYENIAISGFQYRSFANSCRDRPAYLQNTRIYSCMLIKNNIPYRWRGIYNEDTDLSLRVLKDGWCTILFMAFLQDKAGTMTMKGGNTDELYKDDGRLKMAESLMKQHPDIVKITNKKFGRYQHQVDYSSFKKNKLIRKKGIVIPKGINNYGMVLKKVKE